MRSDIREICKDSANSSCRLGQHCNKLHVKQTFWDAYDNDPKLYTVGAYTDMSRDPRQRVTSHQSTTNQGTNGNTNSTEVKQVRFDDSKTNSLPDWHNNVIWTGSILDSSGRALFSANILGSNETREKFILSSVSHFQIKGHTKKENYTNVVRHIQSKRASICWLKNTSSDAQHFSKHMKQMMEKNSALYFKQTVNDVTFRMYCLNPHTEMARTLKLKKLTSEDNIMILILENVK